MATEARAGGQRPVSSTRSWTSLKVLFDESKPPVCFQPHYLILPHWLTPSLRCHLSKSPSWLVVRSKTTRSRIVLAIPSHHFPLRSNELYESQLHDDGFYRRSSANLVYLDSLIRTLYQELIWILWPNIHTLTANCQNSGSTDASKLVLAWSTCETITYQFVTFTMEFVNLISSGRQSPDLPLTVSRATSRLPFSLTLKMIAFCGSLT